MRTQASNFLFLRQHDIQLVQLGALAERYFHDDANTCLIKLRQFGELLAQLIAAKTGLFQTGDESQADMRRQGENTERLYLFIKNEAELAALKESTEDSKTLFGYLESLFLCDLIDEVRVTVEHMDGNRVKFVQMSEGEQQLLTVLGLLLFTQNDESLYLLDEPDTHLNPVWTYDFLKLLQENIRAEKGQLIVATHNPLMIGSLHKNQVRVLTRTADGIDAAEPEDDPIGIGVEGLLKSELYGLRSTLAPEILQKLDRHYALLGEKVKTDVEQAELMRLATELNELGVARTHPNPYFDAFANAMARRRPHGNQPTLSKEEIDAQAKLSDEVLEEVRPRSGKVTTGTAREAHLPKRPSARYRLAIESKRPFGQTGSSSGYCCAKCGH